jgi:hypothetical protein
MQAMNVLTNEESPIKTGKNDDKSLFRALIQHCWGHLERRKTKVASV